MLLGAGLDARPFRLDLHSDTAVYEVDTPPVLRFKQDVLDRYGLKPAGVRVPVEVDLRDDWSSALTTAGFSPAEPAAWVAEGLIMYLAPGDAKSLFAGITQMSAPGSTVAGEILTDPSAPTIPQLATRRTRRLPKPSLRPTPAASLGNPRSCFPLPTGHAVDTTSPKNSPCWTGRYRRSTTRTALTHFASNCSPPHSPLPSAVTTYVRRVL